MINNIEYDIVYSNRRSIAVQISKQGKVIVRCNYRVSKRKIDEFVSAKRDWIISNVNNVLHRIEANENSHVFLLLGERYSIIRDNTEYVYFDDALLHVPETITNDALKQAIKQIYRDKALAYIPERVKAYEKIMNLNASKVGITAAQTRWGSCSGKNSLNFSLWLMQANKRIIDYVIVHELAHIQEKNHGRGFWKLVEKYIPGYKDCIKALKQLEI